MFQPSPAPKLIPKLIQAKIPLWFAVAIVAVDVVVVQVGHPKEPSCTLNMEYPHHSTSLKEQTGIDAIKLNIVTECTVDQSYTLINATIKERSSGKIIEHEFLQSRANAASDDHKKAYFKNLWKRCTLGVGADFAGSATGTVHLPDGRTIPVSNELKNYFPQNCRITAK